MVSIILPTYNGEKYIKSSIQSILEQSYPDWELIVIDDCSTDSTNTIVQKFVNRDKRIKLYRNSENLRLPASLNIGFKKSQGDYLTWTSDDNLYKPYAIERLLKALQKSNQIGLVFSRMEYIDANGKSKGLSDLPGNTKELHYHNIIGASFMYTREVYEKIGDYDTGKFLMEDYDYWLRIFKVYPIKYLPDILYQYRQHENSLTETRNRQILKSRIQLLEEELASNNLDSDTLKMLYKEIAEASFSLDQYLEMKKYLIKLKHISSDMSNVRKAVRISYFIGPGLSSIMKKLLKKGNKHRSNELLQ